MSLRGKYLPSGYWRRSLEAVKSVGGFDEHEGNVIGYLFTLPNIIVFAVFMFIPVAAALFLSFHKYNILSGKLVYIGLEHYNSILQPWPWDQNWYVLNHPTHNLFWYSIKNTVIFTFLLVPGEIAIGLGLALLVNKGIRLRSQFRAAYFIPVIMTPAIAGVIWRWILSGKGILNYFLEPLGLAYNWAADPTTALGGLVVMGIWSAVGWDLIIFLAGLQNIPEELYEASRIDGASEWERFRYVTWPSLQNTLFFVLVFDIIKSFQVFAHAMVFAQGGPYYGTTTIVVYIYKVAFEYGHLGKGSAVAFLLFLILFAFTYYQYRVRKQNEVEY